MTMMYLICLDYEEYSKRMNEEVIKIKSYRKQRGTIMKINQKAVSILAIVSSIVTIFLAVLHFITDDANIDIVMIFLGITQLFGGLSQVNLAQELNSKGVKKGSKAVGVFAVITGILIIVAFIVKRIVY